MSNIKICLDAGHYGKYNRSPVVPNYYESDMTWKLTNMQKEVFEQKYGISVILTRSRQDVDLDLFGRGYKSKGCNLFISNHSNASGTESVDYPVAICMINDVKTNIDDISRNIGVKLADVVEKVMGTKQNGRIMTKQSGVDRNKNGILDDEYYGVLNGAKQAGTPGIIMEHSFHTNINSAKWLLNENNLRRLAEEECRVVAEYFGVNVFSNVNNGTKNNSKEFKVRVLVKDLNIRTDPSMFGKVVGQTGEGVFTIVKQSGSWGLLKSYAKNENGWIYLGNKKYTQNV